MYKNYDYTIQILYDIVKKYNDFRQKNGGFKMNLENETKDIMRKYNISAAKKFGQNFLIDDEAVSEIVRSADVNKEDLIIEIGPGLGTLTKELLDKAGKVICIEIDERMLKVLENRFGGDEKFEIINEDVLKVDLQKIIAKNVGSVALVAASPEVITPKIKRAKVVANLPYYITTPIIMKLLEDKLNLESITVMVQKEVADRLVTQARTWRHRCDNIRDKISRSSKQSNRGTKRKLSASSKRGFGSNKVRRTRKAASRSKR